MQEHPSLVALPDAYEVVFPALAELELPHETRSTCHDCVQAAPEGQEPDLLRPFDREVRCCTYRPVLPNYLVGRALLRRNEGSEKVMDRIIAYREGVTELGVSPPATFKQLYRDGAFGVDRRLTCPYWVPGDLSCSIWQDRNAVCRTWYCRMGDGPRSLVLWNTVRDALTAIERHLAAWLVRTGSPPPVEAQPQAWVDWYIDCHHRLQAADPTVLAQEPFEERRGLEVALRVYHSLLEAPVPDVVFPVITARGSLPDALLLQGYSRLDSVVVPRTFMALFGKLVMGVPWRDALDQVQTESGVTFEEGLVEHLWRRGIVTWPLHAEQPPELQAWLDLCAREGLPVPGSETVDVEPSMEG